MSQQRILFMGTPEFAVASLDALVAAGIEVAAVITAPDRPAGRGRQLRGSAVKERAVALGLPLLQPERLRDPAFLAELDSINADLFVVVAFRMLPEAVWAKPKLGTINLHGSLLPQYRGAAPINWAVMNGERSTGATTFFIGSEIDTGDVIARDTIAIGPDETAGELHDRLKAMGAQLLARTVQGILDGSNERAPQSTIAANAELRSAPKLSPANCRIDWQRPANTVHDHVRGLSPHPGAWTQALAADATPTIFKVHRSRLVEAGSGKAHVGGVHVEGERLLVQCGDGPLEVLELQPEGRKRMSAAEFVRGNRNINGLTFE